MIRVANNLIAAGLLIAPVVDRPSPGKLREADMTIQELNRAVRDAGEPQGVE